MYCSAVGPGPDGSLLSVWGWYFEKKESLIQEWQQAMICDVIDLPYPTEYDGIDELKCTQSLCANEKSIVHCNGQWGHQYPLTGNASASAEIAFKFMKDHPRKQNLMTSMEKHF